MGALIRRCDKLRSIIGAHLMLVHHTGKDISQGARGHSLLRAAVDTEIELRWDKDTQSGAATMTKQRNMRTEGTFTFRLDEVALATEEGKLVTACVVVPLDDGAVTTPTKRMSKAVQTAVLALQKAIGESDTVSPASEHIPGGINVVTYDRWRDYAYREGISTGKDRAKQQAFKRASEHLIGGGYVGRSNDLVWLIQKPL
jgi:hypothetical protein